MCSPDLFLAGFDIFDHFLHLRQEMAIKGGTIHSFFRSYESDLNERIDLLLGNSLLQTLERVRRVVFHFLDLLADILHHQWTVQLPRKPHRELMRQLTRFILLWLSNLVDQWVTLRQNVDTEWAASNLTSFAHESSFEVDWHFEKSSSRIREIHHVSAVLYVMKRY